MVDLHVRRQLRFLEPIPSGTPSAGRLAKPVQAVLFDVYGTLFISGCGDIAVTEESPPTPSSALAEVLRQFGIVGTAADLTRHLHRKIRNEHQRKRTMGIEWPEIDIVSIWQAILGWTDAERVRAFALVYEGAVNPCYPMPGLDHTLRVLRARGVTMGLISNAQFYTPLLFEWFLGGSPSAQGFDRDLTVYSYRCGEAKPSKALFNRCAIKLRQRGIPPDAVAYVGNDIRNDIRPASEMAWQTVLFAGDRRSLRWCLEGPDCRAVHPDLVITDLRELLDWV